MAFRIDFGAVSEAQGKRQEAMRGLMGASTAAYKQRQQQEKAAMAQQDIMAAVDSGDPEKIARVMIRYPGYAESLRDGWNFRNDAQKKRAEKEIMDTITTYDTQGPLATLTKIQGVIDSRQAAGEDATKQIKGGDLLVSDHRAFRKSLDAQLAALSGPEKYLETRGQIAEGERGLQEREMLVEERGAKTREAELLQRDKEFKIKLRQLPKPMQDELLSAQAERVRAAANERRYLVLADRIEKANLGGGVKEGLAEWFKTSTGKQDIETILRKEFTNISMAEAMERLPQGSASDADVALALRSSFDDITSGPVMAQWLRGVARLAGIQKKYNRFKDRYITKNRNTEGMVDAWEKSKEHKEIQKETAAIVKRQKRKRERDQKRARRRDIEMPATMKSTTLSRQITAKDFSDTLAELRKENPEATQDELMVRLGIELD